MSEEEQLKTINSLPGEVLIEIFGFFSPKLLKLSCLVCTRWNNLISQSTELMRKYSLNLQPAGLATLTAATSVKRKFLHAKIGLLNETVLDVLQLHNLLSLEITDNVIEKQMLVSALSCMKRLESLTTDRVQFISSPKETKADPVELNLMELKFRFSDPNILSLISTETLKNFSCEAKDIRKGFIALILKDQQLLENLTLAGGIAVNVIKDLQSLDYRFKLRKLEIGTTPFARDIETAQSFLNTHKDNLLELNIDCSINKQLLFFIIRNMRKLEVLKIPSKVESDIKFEEIGLKLESLKQLTLLNVRNDSSVKELLKCFPSLKTFNVETIWEDCLTPILFDVSQRYRQLKQLRVSDLHDCFDLHLPNLKELHITRITSEPEFKIFVDRNSTLERISIGWISESNFSFDIISILKSCENSKYICIASQSPMINREFTDFKKDHAWTLESRFVKNRNHETEWVKVVFKLPDDKALFEDKCTIWDDQLVQDFQTVSYYGINAYVNQHK